MADTMYAAKVNSPTTALDGAINDSVTTITVVNSSVLPSAPNLATIGVGEDSETVLYTGIDSEDLTGCTRGFDGAAKAWDDGTIVARRFTAYDHDAFIDNIDDVRAPTGATVPTSPAAGEFFLHAPTGRKVLLQYDGSNWISIISYGTMTMYVDKTDGTDDMNHGTAADSSAFATIQYAIDMIPSVFRGDVAIYINGEDYDEGLVLKGKVPSGAYTIYIIGDLGTGVNLIASDTGSAGTGNTMPTWADTGLTNDAYNGYLMVFTSGDNDEEERVVYDTSSTEATAITMAGPVLEAAPVLNDTATVYPWGTTANYMAISDMGNCVSIRHIKFDATFYVSNSIVDIDSCYFSPTSEMSVVHGSSVSFTTTRIQSSLADAMLIIGSKSYGSLTGCMIIGPSKGGSSEIRVEESSNIFVWQGNIISQHSTGINVYGGSIHDSWTGDLKSWAIDCTTGIAAWNHGQGLRANTDNYYFNNNDTNVSGDAGSYSYAG